MNKALELTRQLQERQDQSKAAGRRVSHASFQPVRSA